MPPRIPTEADFSSLKSTLPLTVHFPSPPESTTAFLILFHGLGDSEGPFANFARNLNLPGVLAISVRGTSPLPPSLIDDSSTGGNFHWGDDITLDQSTGELDPDPGYKRACDRVMSELIRGVLIGKCGWEMSDVLLFGFGQGGSLALGMAAQLGGERVVDVSDGDGGEGTSFKGVVTIGGGLPMSMVSTRSARSICDTHVLACQVDGDAEDLLRREFAHVQVVRWRGEDVRMPRDREEVFPMMRFFAERLRSGWS
jgi:pimeloyl-ACP methyl ester carboxylesterase